MQKTSRTNINPSYLAHVELQTSHVPLDGFNLLQRDTDTAVICYWWKQGCGWFKSGNTINCTSIVWHTPELTSWKWHAIIKDAYYKPQDVTLNDTCCFYMQILYSSSLLFLSHHHFSFTSFCFLQHFVSFFLRQWFPHHTSNLELKRQETLPSINSPCRDRTALPVNTQTRRVRQQTA